ncbi:MAG TPA: peptidyl-prolyl cis-trans isomerase, partial [Nitrospirota bacterium]
MKYLAPVLLLGLVFFSCAKTGDDKPDDSSVSTGTETTVSPDVRIVATVDGDPITLAEFEERFSRAGFKPDQEGEQNVKEDFLNKLIERKMLLREAQRKRIKIALPEINKRIDAFRNEHGKDVKEALAGMGIDFEKWKSDVWEDMMIERLISREVNRHISVAPSDVRHYYTAHPEEFEKPEQVRARQIVVATEAEARSVLALLQSKKDFAALAREKSNAPEAERGGDLGYFARGEMPAEFNVVFTLPVHGISGIVKSPYGFHIFRLEDRRSAGKLSFEESSKGIAEKLRQEKEDARY